MRTNSGAAANRGLGMKAIVAAGDRARSRLLPMGGVELLGIERARVQFHIALNVRILFAENLLVVCVNFDSRCYPATGHFTVVFKANILKSFRISPHRLKESDKQQTSLFHP